MIRILAPAKINLGLEVLGKRADGYHEIRTVLCAVSLFDRIAVSHSDAMHVNCTPISGLVENLAHKTLVVAAAYQPDLPTVNVSIAKRIPAAAGLGGASSDAAAALIGLNALSGNRIPESDLVDLASSCGSDVPFFLRGGIAIGAGRGDELEHLPPRAAHAVLVVPTASVPGKTRLMYSRLRETDWSTGDRVNRIAEAIKAGMPLPESDLANAFERALYDLLPETRAICDSIAETVGRRPHLSGAGPAMYVVCASAHEASSLRSRLVAAIPTSTARIYPVRSVAGIVCQGSPHV